MPPTLKAIAKKAGVSYATVSMALNDDPKVAAETKERIRSLALEMNYVPNNFGRALQSRKSRIIGFLVPNLLSSFISEIFQGIGSAASENGYGLLAAIAASGEKLDTQIRIFMEKRVDGLIVSGSSPELLEKLSPFERSGIPLVLASSQSSGRNIPNVITDNYTGGALATEHLVSLGHRRIAFAFYDGGESLSAKEKRYRGCRDTLKKHSLPARPALVDPAALLKALKSSSAPTAIVAYSDDDAIRVKHAAESAGLKIPDDLSLTGFDDIKLASLPEYDFTTVAQEKEEIGRIAVEILLKKINGEAVESRVLTPKLIKRGSTRKVNLCKGGQRSR